MCRDLHTYRNPCMLSWFVPPLVQNKSNWSKNIQNLPDMLFVFEIFEIVQESRKFALCSHQLVG